MAPLAGRLRVGAAQHAMTSDVAENLATCQRMLDAAGAEGLDLVVLPEFCNHPSIYRSDDEAWDVAIDLEGSFVEGIAAKAAEHGMWVQINSTVRRVREPLTITATNLIFDAAGALVATSDKTVLMGGERIHMTQGIEPNPVFPTPWGTIGTYSCMEGVVCEAARGLVVRGALLLCNSLNSFALDEAQLHIPVRAVENKVFVVAANKVGPLLDPEMTQMMSARMKVPAASLCGAGESQIVAPDGTVLAMAPKTGEAIIWADIDLADALVDRRTRPDGTNIATMRRAAVYGPIAQPPVIPDPLPPSGARDLCVVILPITADAADVAASAAAGAELIVLPELWGIDDLTAEESGPMLEALAAAVSGTDALVVTSVAAGGSLAAVVVDALGVAHTQRAMHLVARHPWMDVARLADSIAVFAAPFGRLAVLAGDDVLVPEVGRLAAIARVEVLAASTVLSEATDLTLVIPERAAENRLSVVAASADAGITACPHDGQTLWTGTKVFDGSINAPEVHRSEPGAVLHAVVHPAFAANRTISRDTDLVDGRAWQPARVLVEPASSV